MSKPTDSNELDVLIIGAGATGAAVAWSLSDAGISVMCLDQGDWVAPTQYHLDERGWELSRWSDFHPDPNSRGLAVDYPVNNAESAIAPLMYNAVGGSTIHWGAHFPRFHPSDFKVRSLDGVADDFPYDYAELVPYFDINDRMMGVSGLDGDPFYPTKSPRPMPPLALGPHGETIAKGFDKLGWHWWPADAAIASTAYKEGRRACNYGSSCDLGCMTGAKASTVHGLRRGLVSGNSLLELMAGYNRRSIIVMGVYMNKKRDLSLSRVMVWAPHACYLTHVRIVSLTVSPTGVGWLVKTSCFIQRLLSQDISKMILRVIMAQSLIASTATIFTRPTKAADFCVVISSRSPTIQALSGLPGVVQKGNPSRGDQATMRYLSNGSITQSMLRC